jgi:hypothetical protein
VRQEAVPEAYKVAQRPFSSVFLPPVRDFLEVMDEAVEQPLDVDLSLPAVGEAVELLVTSEVGENRLHNRQTPAVDLTRLRLVDLAPHLRGEGSVYQIVQLVAAGAEMPQVN